MLTRRQLLSRGTTLLMMVPVIPAVLQACSSSSSSGGGAPEQSCPSGSFTTNSSFDDDHSHLLCIPTSDITNPPANGATYTALENGSHVHTVVLSAAQLAAIGAGGSAMVTSSSDLDPISGVVHPHTFNISKPSASTPPPPSAPSGW
jgi:hypothetical protein